MGPRPASPAGLQPFPLAKGRKSKCAPITSGSDPLPAPGPLTSQVKGTIGFVRKVNPTVKCNSEPLAVGSRPAEMGKNRSWAVPRIFFSLVSSWDSPPRQRRKVLKQEND